jgi:hypothetical protein
MISVWKILAEKGKCEDRKSNHNRNFHFLENKGEGQVKRLEETKLIRGTHRLSSTWGGVKL